MGCSCPSVTIICSCTCMINPFCDTMEKLHLITDTDLSRTRPRRVITPACQTLFVAATASHLRLAEGNVWTTRKPSARPSSEHEQSVIVVAVGRGCDLYRHGALCGRGEETMVGRMVGSRPSVGTVRRGWFPSKHTTCKRQLPDTRPHQAIVTVPASLLHLVVARSRCSLPPRLIVDEWSCHGMHGS